MSNIYNNLNKIERYKLSIEKFINTKSTTKQNPDINNLLKSNDYLITIFLLIFSSHVNHKKKIQQHGYYIGTCFELYLLLLNEKIENVTKQRIISLINLSFIQNLEQSATIIPKEKLSKHYATSLKLLNTNILSLYENKFTNDDYEKYTSSDIMYYKKQNREIIITKLKNKNKIKKDILLKYIENTYGNITQFACNCVYLSNNKHIQKLGYYFGILIKYNHDLENFENDLLNDNIFCDNLIINLGICNSFEYFYEIKRHFFELNIKLDIFNNNIKELVEFIESKFDTLLNDTENFMEEENI